MTKFVVIERKEVDVVVNRCICGNTPEIESHTGCAYSAGAYIKCTCGLKMSHQTDSLGYDGETLLSLAQKCAQKWNNIMKRNNLEP